jgi:hypothetical protein
MAVRRTRVVSRLLVSRLIWRPVGVVLLAAAVVGPLAGVAEALPAPVLVAPADGSSTTNLKPTFRWQAVTGATSYRIQVATDADVAFQTPTGNAVTASTSFVPAAPLAWQTYRWRVRMEGGGPGDWSNVWRLTLTASLTQSDEVTLNSNLETLSTGWQQDAVNSANAILSNATYTSTNWANYFQTFFNTTAHPYTNHLRNYLGYPVHWWFDEPTHQRLQEGLTVPLLDRIDALMAANGANLGPALDADPNLRESLFNSHGMLDQIGTDNDVSTTTRETVFSRYRSLIVRNARYLRSGAIDTTAQPYVATLRAQTWMTFRDARTVLDATTKAEIAATLPLSGRRLDIWNLTTTLLHDNNQMSSAQQNVIYNLLNGIPRPILDLGNITQREMLGNTGTRYVGITGRNSVNVVPDQVGQSSENSFPADIAPRSIDGFSVVAAHEFNHIVDGAYIGGNRSLRNRKNALLAQAGTVDLQ